MVQTTKKTSSSETPSETFEKHESPTRAPSTRDDESLKEKRATRDDVVRRGRIIQPLRRAILGVSLLSIFVLPLAQLARAAGHGAGSAQVASRGPGLDLATSIPGLAALGDVISGSVWSVTIFGFDIADPLAAALVVAAGQSAVLLVAAAIPIAATLILGRVFCGWICPARLPVELAAWTRRKTKHKVLKAPWLRWLKYGVLAGGLLLAILTGWNLVALIYPPAILVREAHYLLAYSSMGWGAVVIGVAFVADLVVDRGVWCRGLCPGGALYSLLGQPAIVRMTVDDARCTRCRRCEKVCPLGLDPTQAPRGECDRCGLCQRECRDDALRYRLSSPFERSREQREE